jgi:hypothetical protein
VHIESVHMYLRPGSAINGNKEFEVMYPCLFKKDTVSMMENQIICCGLNFALGP